LAGSGVQKSAASLPAARTGLSIADAIPSQQSKKTDTGFLAIESPSMRRCGVHPR
jgi:hypothetical protein